MKIIINVLRAVSVFAFILFSATDFNPVHAESIQSSSIQASVAANSSQQDAIIATLKTEYANPAQVNAASVAGTLLLSDVSSTMRGKINWLLVAVVILLFAVITLVLDILTTVGKIQGKPVLDWNSINSKLLIGFLVAGMFAVIWEFAAHTKLTVNSYDGASAHADEYDSMFNITFFLTLIVFFITQILLFWYGYKYKHSKKRKALFYPDNHKLELAWTVIPAVVLTILVIRGLKSWNEIMNNKDEKAQIIEVFGYQFGWNARYAGADNKLGNHDFREMGKINALGVDVNDPKAKDDIVTNELHLKVGQPVELKFRAKDVIHSAYMPHFRVQMNVVPGLPTKFAFTPTITTAEMRTKLKDPKFDYVLLCNKICGGAHYRMKMKVVVSSPAEYDKWLRSQPKLVQKNNTPAAESANANAQANTEDNQTLAAK